MKNIFFAITLIISLCSCVSISERAERATFSSPEEINEWVYLHIEWEDCPDSEDTVSTAQETLAKGSGSCYEQAIVFIFLAKRAGFADAKLYPVATQTGYHMCVWVDYYIYDPTNFARYYILPQGWTSLDIKLKKG